jgi:flagellar capping protein FliD
MSGLIGVSGLASGVDWRNIIDQLKALEEKKIDLVKNQQTSEKDRLSTWQSINSKLLNLKTVVGKLNEPADFNLFSSTLFSNTAKDADALLAVTAGTSASPGTYQVIINSLASAQKLSSNSFASQNTALGLSGDIVVGGRTVAISATDTLSSLRDKMNAVNTGTNASKVTASIVSYGTGGYRLILTSDEEGAAGLSLLNGGSTDLLGTLGFVDASAKTAKNSLTGGHQSDAFSAADEAIGGADLLNLTSAQSGSVTLTINGTSHAVAINLATDSLNTIRDSINAAFGSTVASVLSETDDRGNTTYRLLIEGSTITYTDSNNILETLGVLKRAGVSDERGMTADTANTSAGVAITSSTLIRDIDGYNDYASGDTITLSGTDTNGGAVNSVFTLTDATTVEDLLTEIESRFGNVTASFTADGRIRVVTNEIGDTDLAVNLTPSRSTLRFDADGNLGALSTVRGDVANYSGGLAITPSTLIRNIDGYTNYAVGDTITLAGTSTSGGAVSSVFTITDATTVNDLLTEIQARYGEVTTSLTADGKIQVKDNEAGDTHLSVTLTPSKSTLKFDTDNNLGAAFTIRTRQVQAGANASLSVDGVPVTPSSNTVTDVIPGVTLNLKGAASDTTLTVNVGRDYDQIKEQITEFVTAYNELMDLINGQLTYDTATQTPGGPLFGDATLRSLKSGLARTIVNRVPGLDNDFSTLGLVGISLGKDGKLTTDSSTLQDYLETNFEDVKNLFVASASSTNGGLTYIDHNYKTQAGTYNLQITGVNPVAGYFLAPGDASGSGEVLTGISGNAQGLVVRYSGTGTGSIGSMTLTYGVAELLDRSLYQITDSTYGYLPGKQEAIQETIKHYDERIATMEARVEKKMGELELRFIAMESTLSSLQNVSSWLSSQIKSLNGG